MISLGYTQLKRQADKKAAKESKKCESSNSGQKLDPKYLGQDKNGNDKPLTARDKCEEQSVSRRRSLSESKTSKPSLSSDKLCTKTVLSQIDKGSNEGSKSTSAVRKLVAKPKN